MAQVTQLQILMEELWQGYEYIIQKRNILQNMIINELSGKHLTNDLDDIINDYNHCEILISALEAVFHEMTKGFHKLSYWIKALDPLLAKYQEM